ncbi:MAG: YhbY family RNA-binding protein [Pseudomonadota bacterium]
MPMPNTIPLTARQRQHLKALAHPLRPVVWVGQAGLSESILQETDRALTIHELIKLRVPAAASQTLETWRTLFQPIDAEVVQRIGRMLVIYRTNPQKIDGIRLPR